MNSQNRMNAGAQYVLYRIWATLQDGEGIHAESLLACVGALAGYACQAYARRVGSALDAPLVASPISVWALVRRAVQKRGGPLPDIEDISAHVARTLGTSDFGVPRVPDEHRPRLPPIVYLRQLWPQVLPIAQQFCRRPAQLPVLFGIALQRAIELTAERLNPTLGAGIAMECAIAMSKVALPARLSELFQAPAAERDIAVKVRTTASASPGASASAAASASLVASRPFARTPSPLERRSANGRPLRVDPKARDGGSALARMRSTKVVATVMSLVIVAITSAAWKTNRHDEPSVTARVETKLRVPVFRAAAAASTFDSPIQASQTDADTQAIGDTQATENASPAGEMTPSPGSLPPQPEDSDLPAPPPDQGEGVITEDWQST